MRSIKKILSMFIVVFSSVAFSGEAQHDLLDGTYYSPEIDYCGQVIDFDDRGEIHVKVIDAPNGMTCPTFEITFTRSAIDRGWYLFSHEHVFTADDVRNCTPIELNTTPCGPAYYDAKTGKLLVQVGDVRIDEAYMKVISESSYTAGTKIWVQRGESIIVKHPDQNPVRFNKK